MNEVILRGLPMPPSVNALYSTIGKRRVKSKKYVDYHRESYRWLALNGVNVQMARDLAKRVFLLSGNVLHVEAKFYMQTQDIITKAGKPKRNDTSNRLKALHDVLSEIILGIDDSFIWSCTADKEAVEDKMQVRVDVTIRARGM